MVQKLTRRAFLLHALALLYHQSKPSPDTATSLTYILTGDHLHNTSHCHDHQEEGKQWDVDYKGQGRGA